MENNSTVFWKRMAAQLKTLQSPLLLEILINFRLY